MQSINKKKKKKQPKQQRKNGKSIKNLMTTGCWEHKTEIYVLLLNELTAN